LTGVAVKVTEVPVQIVVPGLAARLTLTGSTGFTVIVMAFEVAGEPVAQVKDEVKVKVKRSPLFKVLLV
jgi:hypothetical protein